MPPRVTVVIPCFNHGPYVDDAVDSVLRQTFKDFEIIVVDDGSTDPNTIAKLAGYRRPKTRVIRTANAGPSAARNRGIEAGTGTYILPLDADDRIGETYLEKAVPLLDANRDLGIVYCEAEYFGARTGPWELAPYSPDGILWQNMIFCSALFRRADWKAVGGFRTEMVDGWEDWDFWLSMTEHGCGVYRIPEPLFFYRIWDQSRNREIMKDRARRDATYRLLVDAHLQAYARHVASVYYHRRMLTGSKGLLVKIALAALTHPRPLSGLGRRLAAALRLVAWAAVTSIRPRPRAASLPGE